ncbi:uncharacterized protein LOC129234054 [Uloborus diversus]|uniref:uncharacterized protein LOC129234054 n=1 Tax=Uloborus diversus TaxID=327109 RepID=UPI002409644F|nr:uncharacterized protein LOC129234054 [Uloborus diversus]
MFTKIIRSRRGENLEDLKQKYEENKAVLEKLQDKYNAVQDLISENKQLDSQILDYEDYFLKMTQHMQNRVIAREKLMDKLKKQECELEKLKNEISQKLAVYDAQGFDGRKQQQHFTTLKQELHENYEQKELVFDELKNSCWEKEIQCTETIEKLSSVCSDFNNLYTSSAESAANMFGSIKHSRSPKLEKLWKNI